MARRWIVLVGGVMLAGPALAAERPELSVGVLTPGWHPSTVVVAGRAYSPILLDAVGFGAARSATQRREQQELNDVLVQQGFDPRDALATATIAALNANGASSRSIFVNRQNVGRGNTLRRDELPSDVPATVFLDLQIRYAFLAQTDDEKQWRPGLVVRYLWITPDGQPVGLRRVAVFNRDIEQWGRSKYPIYVGAPHPYADAVAPPAGCEFATIQEARTRQATLRDCFQQGIDALAARIAATLPAR